MTIGCVNEVPDPRSGRYNEYEPDVTIGGLVLAGGQSAAVLEL